MITVEINGEPKLIEDGVSIVQLLSDLGITTNKVAVERNLEIVPKSTYADVTLCDGDRLEIVHFVGGG